MPYTGAPAITGEKKADKDRLIFLRRIEPYGVERGSKQKKAGWVFWTGSGTWRGQEGKERHRKTGKRRRPRKSMGEVRTVIEKKEKIQV